MIEFLLDEDSLKDPNWLRKVKYRIGAIVMEFNYLEREIDDYILKIMNPNYEDETVWIFLENLSTARKIETLSKLYDNFFAHLNFNEEIRNRKAKLFDLLNHTRINRNIYIHSNWLNDFNGQLVEYKTKRLKSGEFGRIHKKITVSDLENDLNLVISLHDQLFEFNEDFFIDFNKVLNDK